MMQHYDLACIPAWDCIYRNEKNVNIYIPKGFTHERLNYDNISSNKIKARLKCQFKV
jgi:hypothetical protein